MIPIINEEGEFPITVKNPRWEEMKQKGTDKARMALVFPCFEDPSEAYPEGRQKDYHLYFTRQLIGSGPNKGRSLYEVSIEQCEMMGATKPFNPRNIYNDFNDKQFIAVIGKDADDRGRDRFQIKFLKNERPALPDDKVDELWNEIMANDQTVTTNNDNESFPL